MASSGYRKFETMTLGVDMTDIEAMIVRPEHISTEVLSDPLKKISEMNTTHGVSADIGRMIHQSEQRMNAFDYGIDYVQDIPLFDTEMHNSAMTEKFIQNKKHLLPSSIGMDELPKDATPFEAYMHSVKKAIDSGDSSIVGLNGMSTDNRELVSKTIGSHLEQYSKNKKAEYSTTLEAIEQSAKGGLPKQTAEEIFQAESQARANAMWDADYLAYIKEKQANKLKSFAENPDDLYAKYLDHVGRIKSKGGILNSGGGLVPDYYSNDPVEIGEKALRNLAEQEELPFSTYELSQVLNTNTNYAHQALVNDYKNGRGTVSLTGETIDDLKANPKYSPSGSATIEEIETVLKKEQIQMMRSRASGLPTGSGAVADANANLAAAAKKPLIQPDKADFLPKKIVNGRPITNANYDKMSVEELLDARAKSYDKLLDPEYANVHPGPTGVGAMHNLDRGWVAGYDAELARRGEDVSMLPDVRAYDSSYVAGSGKRAPYLRSKEPIAPLPTPEGLGAPSAAKVQGTVGEAKAEEVVAKVTTSSESASVKMGEAAAEKVVAPSAVKATATAGVKTAREAATKATAKATDAVGIGIGKVKNFGAKEGAIGAGVAAAAAILTFRNT
jgi:hypothetical protein